VSGRLGSYLSSRMRPRRRFLQFSIQLKDGDAINVAYSSSTPRNVVERNPGDASRAWCFRRNSQNLRLMPSSVRTFFYTAPAETNQNNL
jgi:hypothetical protein